MQSKNVCYKQNSFFHFYYFKTRFLLKKEYEKYQGDECIIEF